MIDKVKKNCTNESYTIVRAL